MCMYVCVTTSVGHYMCFFWGGEGRLLATSHKEIYCENNENVI